MNELGAEFCATPFPRVADAASGGALHASLPEAMYVLTPLGWIIAGNHVFEKSYSNALNQSRACKEMVFSEEVYLFNLYFRDVYTR